MEQNLTGKVLKSAREEIGIQELVRSIWAARYTVLILVTLVMVGFAVYFLIKAYNKDEVYFQHIDFTFEGVENAKYPNGETFRLEDILAPSVVNSVYNELDLGQYGISLKQVTSQLNVFPNLPGRQYIIDEYTPILKDKESSEAEKAEARSEMEAALSRQQALSATIRFVNEGSKLSRAIAGQLVSLIAKTWASQAIELRSVTGKNIELLAPEVINNALNDSQTSIQQLKNLWGYLEILQDQMKNLSTYPGAATITEPETGYTAGDLLALLEQTERELIEVPVAWSNSKQRPLGLNLPLYSPRLFDITLVENLDYLIAIDVLHQRIKLVMSNIDTLSRQDFGGIATDPETGLTLSDLNRLLLDMKQYELKQLRAPLLQLGISKDKNKVSLYYEFRLHELEGEMAALKAKVATIKSAESRYISGGEGVMSSASGDGQASGNGLSRSSTTMIPQFGEAFLDKLVSLGEKGGDVAYRQKLNNEAITLENNAIVIKQEIEEIKSYLSMFNKASKGKFGTTKELSAINASFEEVFNKLKTYAEVSQRISNRLRFAKEIASVFELSSYALPTDAYLQDAGVSQASLTDIKQDLQRYSIVAHKIIKKLNSDRIGVVNDLFVYSGVPGLAPYKLVGKKEMIVFLLMIFLVTVFGVLGNMSARAIKN